MEDEFSVAFYWQDYPPTPCIQFLSGLPSRAYFSCGAFRYISYCGPARTFPFSSFRERYLPEYSPLKPERENNREFKRITENLRKKTVFFRKNNIIRRINRYNYSFWRFFGIIFTKHIAFVLIFCYNIY